MTTEVDRLLVTLEARLDKYNADLSRAGTLTNQRLASIEGRFAAFSGRLQSSASTAAMGIGTAFGGIGAFLGAREVIEYANSWKRVERSIDASGRVFGIALKPAAELSALANEARIDVESYTKTYIRAAAAIRDYGFDSDTAAKVTSTLAKALKLGSASASEQASTILQFSQALQKGKLDGDEFRTVMENAGVVQELLAERLKVSKGEIINMAQAGKLQIPDLVGALVDGGARIERIFKQMPTTVDEAFSVFRNNLTQFIGNADRATGATDKLATGIVTVSHHLDAMAVVAGAILGSASVRMLAFAAATTASINPVTAVAAGIGALATAYGLFGDEVTVSDDRVVSLSDSLTAFLQIAGEQAGAKVNTLIGLLYQLKDASIAARTGLEEIGIAGPSSLDKVLVKLQDLNGEAKSFGDMIVKQLGKLNLLFNPELLKLMIGLTAAMPGIVDQEGFGAIDARARDIANQRVASDPNGRKFGSGLKDYLDGKMAYKPKPLSQDDKTSKRSEFDREVDQIRKRTEALRAELTVTGATTMAQEKAKAAAELRFAVVQTAAKQGRKVSQEELDAIDTLSTAYAEAQAQVAFFNQLQASRDEGKAIQDEIELIGLYGVELEKARIEQELLNAAKRAGIQLTPEQEQAIHVQAEHNAQLVQTRDLLKGIQQQGADALKGFISDLREGKSASEALGNALNRIADRMIEFGIDQLIGAATGGLKSSGIFGGLGLPGFADGGVMVPGQGPRSLPRFAKGGVSSTPAIFGEGPYTEAAVPLPDGRRIPVDLRMPQTAQAGGAATTVNLTVAPVFHVQNGTPDGIAKLKGEFMREMPRMIEKTVNNVFDRKSRFARAGL